MTRVFDIFFSAIGLLILSPLLLVVIFILSITGEREVFYRQSRVGAKGEDFDVFKFATMLKNSPNLGAGTVTVKDDPRVLPIGGFLRASKINELPQLFNVLRGEMSLVGHRPLVRKAYEKYSEEVRTLIDAGLPGLSGIGSLVFRHEEEMLHELEEAEPFYFDTILPYKGLLEMWYQRNKGLKLYFKIILLTALGLVTKTPRNVWVFVNGLPEPPQKLKAPLFFPEGDKI